MTSPEPKKISTLFKWLAVSMSIFMFAYSVFIISTEHYYDYTTRYGGAEVSADGLPAVWIGNAIIVIGLTPMCLWEKSGKAAGF